MNSLRKDHLVCCFIFVLLAAACQYGKATHKTADPVLEVAATIETEPMRTGGDSADDTTLWIDRSDPSQSLIIGTNKKRGLAVYDLNGKLLSAEQFSGDRYTMDANLPDGTYFVILREGEAVLFEGKVVFAAVE